MCLHSPGVSRIVISSISFAGLAEFLRGMGCMAAGWRTFVIKRKATALRPAEYFIGLAIARQEIQSRSFARQHVADANMHAWNNPTHGDGL